MRVYIVVDTRTKQVKWNGSKKDCQAWIINANPLDTSFYKIKQLKGCRFY